MKLDILYHYDVNTITGEIIYIGKEEVTVDTTKETVSKKPTSKKVDSNPEPIVTLDSNKLLLTQGAVDLLKVCEDCRVDIKYKKKGTKAVPVIGTNVAFGSEKSGNKITKSNTVSYRGAANEKLATYGTIFKLEPTENEGLFYMIGDKEEQEEKIPDEIINIESELDINLDELNIDEDDANLEKFDFKL